ncbi:hypothetical protein GWI33_007035 [Rhynchophorus ferrugineus]|uniref:Cytochrome P450 n=1 Tax=Rhynchophorus ferrugineus TaxID=354439 RepID=A0A834IJG4_RHYFE|nr:hypothetical protein GWI33_007035 [Rhynchophorus ferrugineus]
MVIKETLRLYPPVTFIGRKLTKDLEFKGTLYPKDLNIFLIIYYVQLTSEYFEEPEKFNPDRFASYDKKMPYAYTPFSAGSRNCIGQKFAMLEMTSVLSKIVRNFELLPAIPSHKLSLAAEILLVSKTGIKISIKNRT